MKTFALFCPSCLPSPLPCPVSGQDHGSLADEIIITPAASRPPLHSSALTARLILFSSANIDSLGSFHPAPIKKASLVLLLLNLFCSCEKHPAASRHLPAPLCARAVPSVPPALLACAPLSWGQDGHRRGVGVILGLGCGGVLGSWGDALLLRASVSLLHPRRADHFCCVL